MKVKEIKARLYSDVLRLTTVSPARNYSNPKVLNEAAQFIKEEFDKLGSNNSYQEYTVEGIGYKNIIASFGPREGEIIIVGAHYDVAGDQPGADDNASAVAGLLELARMIDQYEKSLPYRIDFVAYCLEEPPYFATDKMGSAFHAKTIYDAKISVKAMICLEMIGYFSDKPNSQGFPNEALSSLYPHTGDFIIVVGKMGQEEITEKVAKYMRANSDINVQTINLPGGEVLAGLSDHRNYWKYGYEAVMVNDTSFLRNPHYHLKTDTIETLNFVKMAEVVKGLFGVLVHF